jgi:hypothetical protein
MSHKAFYQTFYQTEQLFRLPGDLLDFGIAHQPETNTESLPVDALLSDSDEAVLLISTVQVDEPLIVIEEVFEPVDLPEAVLVEPVLPEPVASGPMLPESIPAVVVVGEELAPAPRPLAPQPERPIARTPDLNHKVLILVDEALMPSELLFLERVLKAVNLNPDNVDLLNLHGWEGRDFGPVLAQKVVHHFITFGVPFERLDLDIMMDRYHPVRFDGITFMLADALGVIEADRDLKKRLWDSLQRIFLQR